MATDVGTRALDRAKERRADLRASLHEFEAALAAPVPGRAAEWREVVARATDRLAGAFQAHVAEAEGSGGLLEQITGEAPRLGNEIALLRDEHVSLSTGLRWARTLIDDPSLSPGDLREELMLTCVRLTRHQQRGSDLVYEAYSVDIGTGAD